MRIEKGTPKFLDEAIRDALHEKYGDVELDPDLVECIRLRVKDFLSQKFQIVIAKEENNELVDLLKFFEVLTKRDISCE